MDVSTQPPGFFERVRNVFRPSLESRAITLGDLPPSIRHSLELGTAQRGIAGVTVNQPAAHGVSAWYACLNVLSQTAAQVPLKLRQRTEDDRGRRICSDATQHRLWDIVTLKANPIMSAFTVKQIGQYHLAGWGNFFAAVQLDQSFRVLALWPLLPNRTHLRQVSATEREVVTIDSKGREVVLTEGFFIHIKGLGADGWQGYSPIDLHRKTLGHAIAAATYGSTFFGNGARPSVVIKHPGEMNEVAYRRLSESFNAEHGGPEHSNKTKILEEGADISLLSVPNDSAQFIETRQFAVEDIARLFRMPLHKIQHMIHSTQRANVEQENISFITDTMEPWFVNWELELAIALLGQQKKYYFEFNRKALLRGDMKAQGEAFRSGRQNGWLNADDIREELGYNPLPDDQGGDEYWIPRNMIPIRLVEKTLKDPVPLDSSADGDSKQDDGGDEDSRSSLVAQAEALEPAFHRAAEQCYHLKEKGSKNLTELMRRCLSPTVESLVRLSSLDASVQDVRSWVDEILSDYESSPTVPFDQRNTEIEALSSFARSRIVTRLEELPT